RERHDDYGNPRSDRRPRGVRPPDRSRGDRLNGRPRPPPDSGRGRALRGSRRRDRDPDRVDFRRGPQRLHYGRGAGTVTSGAFIAFTLVFFAGFILGVVVPRAHERWSALDRVLGSRTR